MKTVLLATLSLLTLHAGFAFGAQFFDFNGQALVPAVEGGDLEMYGNVLDASGPEDGENPLPLDFANFEYTIVVTGLTLVNDTSFTDNYSNGTIAIYEDDGTFADYGNTSTFSDGTAILTGVITTFDRTIFFAGTGVGSGTGNVDWTGGSEINQIHPADRIGWTLATGISGGATVQPGYDENWDGKVEPQDPIVATEPTSFGKVKSEF